MQFLDLKTQRERLGGKIERAIENVLAHGHYVSGPEIAQCEKALAQYCHADYALGCANGTDALLLALMGWDIGPGDAVFCPSFSFIAPAEMIALLGATPVFVDIDPQSYNMCPNSLQQAIDMVQNNSSLTPKAVICVDLFGNPCAYPRLAQLCTHYELKLLGDCAQSFGSTLNGHSALHWCDVITTSFFPAKPLGCYGDGGAIFCNDKAFFEKIDSLHIHGKSPCGDKYNATHIGINSRLDSIQAAILLAKLDIFSDELQERQHLANTYTQAFKNTVLQTPLHDINSFSSQAVYTIQVKNRDKLQAHLQEKNIPCAIYYPLSIHQQAAYQHFPCAPLITSQACAKTVLSLPIHPYLHPTEQKYIIETVLSFQDYKN